MTGGKEKGKIKEQKEGWEMERNPGLLKQRKVEIWVTLFLPLIWKWKGANRVWKKSEVQMAWQSWEGEKRMGSAGRSHPSHHRHQG